MWILKPPSGVTVKQQSETLGLINDYNRNYIDSDPGNGALLGRMKSYELAFRMQMAVPEALDVDREPEKIKELYGLNDKIAEPMARRCLMARRMVERGVRFVQVYLRGLGLPLRYRRRTPALRPSQRPAGCRTVEGPEAEGPAGRDPGGVGW